MSKLFQGARILCPSTGRDEIGDVLVNAEGRFESVGSVSATGADVVDCTGLILAPSLVDMEAQFCDPGIPDREDLASGGAAAAAGGFTSVMISPATAPVVDDAAVLRDIAKRAPKVTKVEILIAGAMTTGLEGEELAEMGLLAQAGASALSNGNNQVPNSSTLRFALLYARPFGLPVLLRAGDQSLEVRGAMHEGAVSNAIGLRGLPAAAEEIGVARLLAMARATGVPIHITGVTTARGVKLISAAKADGLHVTASTTAHHLFLTDEAVRDSSYSSNTRLMPPLRSHADRDALRAGVISGAIDVVCSQHQPVTRVEKELEFELAEPGAIGLQCALNETIAALGGDFGAAIQALSIRPAAILGLERSIGVGAEANFLLWNPLKEWSPLADTLRSRCSNSPVLGQSFTGQVVGTYRAGESIGPE